MSSGSTGDPPGWAEYPPDHAKEFGRFLKDDLPPERRVTVEEVASPAAFLLGPKGRGITGGNLAVDGGQYRPHAIRFPRSV